MRRLTKDYCKYVQIEHFSNQYKEIQEPEEIFFDNYDQQLTKCVKNKRKLIFRKCF